MNRKRTPQILILGNEQITLTWYDWEDWNSLSAGNEEPPRGEPGVYEVAYRMEAENPKGSRLIIGMTGKQDLYTRVLEYMIRGRGDHGPGTRLRSKEQGNLQNIVVSWAKTTKAAEVEACLFRRYQLLHEWDIPTYCNEIPFLRGGAPCHFVEDRPPNFMENFFLSP